MSNEQTAEKWRRQAEADLKAAKDSARTNNYSWACFAAQQAAEKYLKAYLFRQGQRVLETHSLRKLVAEAAEHEEKLGKLEKSAKELDKVYFSARYPDALADDIPADYYTEEDAQTLIKHAQKIQEVIVETFTK